MPKVATPLSIIKTSVDRAKLANPLYTDGKKEEEACKADTNMFTLQRALYDVMSKSPILGEFLASSWSTSVARACVRQGTETGIKVDAPLVINATKFTLLLYSLECALTFAPAETKHILQSTQLETQKLAGPTIQLMRDLYPRAARTYMNRFPGLWDTCSHA